MIALTRLRTAPHEKAAIAAYCECMREYRAMSARRARQDWLLQEQNRIVRRINVIKAKQRYAVEERLCPRTLARQLGIEEALLSDLRDELEAMREI